MKERLKNAKGFTLIELAIVLVIIGIILGAVLKGQELINNAKAERVVNDSRGLVALAYTFYDRYGRFPGDCNASGTVNYTNATATPTTFAATATPEFCYPPVINTALPNHQWNELLQAQLLSGIPRDLAKNLYNGAMYFAGLTSGGVVYNAIMQRQIPCYAAKMLDKNIDGSLDAGLGSIREKYVNAFRTTTNAWTNCTASESTLVDVVYLFDKTPN